MPISKAERALAAARGHARNLEINRVKILESRLARERRSNSSPVDERRAMALEQQAMRLQMQEPLEIKDIPHAGKKYSQIKRSRDGQKWVVSYLDGTRKSYRAVPLERVSGEKSIRNCRG